MKEVKNFGQLIALIALSALGFIVVVLAIVFVMLAFKPSAG